MLIGSGGLALLLAVVLSMDHGEVATLTTFDESGRSAETELWIVDLGDTAYVRATDDHDAWVERVRERPEARLHRGESTMLVRAVAVDDPRTRAAVSRAMSAKYRRFDWAARWLRDADRFVPVRLEPITAAH